MQRISIPPRLLLDFYFERKYPEYRRLFPVERRYMLEMQSPGGGSCRLLFSTNHGNARKTVTSIATHRVLIRLPRMEGTLPHSHDSVDSALLSILQLGYPELHLSIILVVSKQH